MSGIYKTEDIATEIREHLDYRGNSDVVNLLWTGHLGGLFYGGRLELDEFFILLDVLKPVGRVELRELFTKLMDPAEANGASGFFELMIETIKADPNVEPEEGGELIAVIKRLFEI